jgi:hypothetical protein
MPTRSEDEETTIRAQIRLFILKLYLSHQDLRWSLELVTKKTRDSTKISILG